MNTRLALVLALAMGIQSQAATPAPAPVADTVAAATPSGNPYATLVNRNVFGLVPIPVVDPASLTPSTPPPKITPNGIMTLFGKLQVLFKVQQPAAGGQPAKEVSYTMGVGERQDEIEVQKIDETAATITFNNHGTVQTLELAKAAAGAPAGAPPAGGVPPGGIPRPGTTPAMAAGTAGAAVPPVGNRFGRNRSASAGTSGEALAGGTHGSGGAAATATPSEQLTPEQQIILIEAQRQKYKAEGNPAAAILPPTPITKDLESDAAGGND